MGKKRGSEHRQREQLRTTGRVGPARDIRGRDQERLHSVSRNGGGTVLGKRTPPSPSTRLPNGDPNWLVRRERGDILAVEPNGDYEHVFTGGPDPFGEALKFAAARLRKEHGERHPDVA